MDKKQINLPKKKQNKN